MRHGIRNTLIQQAGEENSEGKDLRPVDPGDGLCGIWTPVMTIVGFQTLTTASNNKPEMHG